MSWMSESIESVCRYCRQDIYRTGDEPWRHYATARRLCTSITEATPIEG